MSKGPVPTDLNAYVIELEAAREEVVRAQSRVTTLERQIDEKRVEQGLEPLYEENAADDAEYKPEDAKGFGKRQGDKRRRQARSGTTTDDDDDADEGEAK